MSWRIGGMEARRRWYRVSADEVKMTLQIVSLLPLARTEYEVSEKAFESPRKHSGSCRDCTREIIHSQQSGVQAGPFANHYDADGFSIAKDRRLDAYSSRRSRRISSKESPTSLWGMPASTNNVRADSKSPVVRGGACVNSDSPASARRPGDRFGQILVREF